LAIGSDDGEVRVWDLRQPIDASTPPMKLRGATGSVDQIAFSNDNHWLVTAGEDPTPRLWNMTAPDPSAAAIVLTGHTGISTNAIFSPDSRWLMTASTDGSKRLWPLTGANPAAGSLVLSGTLPSEDLEANLVEPSVFTAVTFSPDSHWLFTGDETFGARLWDMTASNPAAAPLTVGDYLGPEVHPVFSPDNRWLVTYGAEDDDIARLWDLTAPDPVSTSIALRAHEAEIVAAAFSPDSHWLITGANDWTARLWDLTAPDPSTPPVALYALTPSVNTVVVSPDGRWLVTSGPNQTVRLWHLRLDELIDLGCRAIGSNFTQAEWARYFPGQPYRQTCKQWPAESDEQ
jgi:WD40 repeat protein